MQATPMMTQYLEIKSRHTDSLLFYRMGDFYELFFDDAVEAAKTLDIALTTRGKHLENDIPMCGVPVHSHENYLQKLIKAGHRIAIAEQLEDPAEAKKRGYKEVVKRDVVRIVTPGTITEEGLLSSSDNNFLVCLAFHKDTAAAAWIDLAGRMLCTQNFEPLSCESLLAQLAPKEILISERALDQPDLYDCFKKWKGVMTVIQPQKYNERVAEDALQRGYGVHTSDVFGKLDGLEKTALGVLVDYVQLTQKIAVSLPYPRQISPAHFMAIDSNTRQNLELTMTQKGLRDGSLLDCMDLCITQAGSRLLARMLASPLASLIQINKRLDAVSYFVGTAELRDKIRQILKATPDLERALTRIMLRRAKPRDLAVVRTCLRVIQQVKIVFDSIELPALVQQSYAQLGTFDVVLGQLQAALNDELPAQFQDGGMIRSGYAPELDELRNLKENSDEYIKKLQLTYVQDTGVNSLKIKYNNVLGYFIEVTPQHADKLMGKFTHRQSLANNVRFSSPELAEVEKKINNAVAAAQALEMEYVSACMQAIMEISDALYQAAMALAQIDVMASLGELAVTRNYVRPTLDDTTHFDIEGGRHPLVEMALNAQNHKPFVANNCNLNQDRIWLITGPNMGGKSTFLRQNALIAIMAQMGSFVPAIAAHIGIVDRLFSRVGAADDLARNQSTFMVEMVETALILHQATEKSLVILDEIGRGTSTNDGLAIAWSVLEHVHASNRCRTLFATHYHELTRLKESLPALGLYTTSVKEWDNQVIFMHKIILGSADKSYGIHVAKLAGLPKTVVTRAEEILSSLGGR